MSFGGYKFKGYKVTRENLVNNTYSNWCLIIHKARIKAFIESCSLSGALWNFSKTDGDLSFENYGNVIFRVANDNGEYNNYMSFFKYGNEELYYMISTLGEYYKYSSSKTPQINSNAIFGQYIGSSKYTKPCNISSSISYQNFSNLGVFDDFPINALKCTSCCCDNVIQNSYFDNNSSSTDSVFVNNSLYIGYVTKNKDIITITGRSLSGLVFCIESIGGLSYLTDSEDNYNIFKCILRNYNSEEMTYYSSSERNLISCGYCETLTSDGNSVCSAWNGGYYCKLCLTTPTLAVFNNITKNIPFESTSLLQDKNSSIKLNESGIRSKGVINNELLSINASSTKSNLPSLGTSFMGGKMLCARVCEDRSGNEVGYVDSGCGQYYTPALYIGWDESNPNISDDSSWIEL